MRRAVCERGWWRQDGAIGMGEVFGKAPGSRYLVYGRVSQASVVIV